MPQLTSLLSLRQLTSAEASCPALLPIELRSTQFPFLDPEWVWIVEHKDFGPCALIVGSNCHGVFIIWQVLSTAKAKSIISWFLASFPAILENARLRGCVGYGSFFKDSSPQEVKLSRLLARSGGHVEPFVGSFGAALIPNENARTLSSSVAGHRSDRIERRGDGDDSLRILAAIVG